MTTNLDAMVFHHEGFLELAAQGVVEFPGGPQRRYSPPPAEPVALFGILDDAESKQ